MGLLDQILGGLAGNIGGGSPMQSSQAGGGMGNVMMALLPVVLGMLSNRQGGGAAAMPGGGGAAIPGGLGGLLEQLNRGGFGQQAASWVGTGTNEPMPPDAWSQVLQPGQLAAIAAQAGVSEDDARSGLSALVPHVVDQLTPQGQMPEQDQLTASIDAFAKQLGR
jgi:uncharacterized protein YidB (DUF937 family)